MRHSAESPLYNTLAEILCDHVGDDEYLITAINNLAKQHGDEVYSEFFYLLTRKRFCKSQASKHWKRIVPHVDSVIAPQYRHQGLLLSFLHYLHRETGVISDPRLVESEYIDNILATSTTDGLTGLYNQTFFKNCLTKLIQQFRRNSMPELSLVLFDLDHFKHYNDTNGHLAGDRALKRVAEVLSQNLREGDLAARYGGEEFALVLPHTSKVQASAVAQRIRQAIEHIRFPGQNLLPSGNLTISGGIATFPVDACEAEGLIEQADCELYNAKNHRNCISPDTTERRKAIRRPIRSLVELMDKSKGAAIRSALSLDVSRNGIALGCDAGFRIGSGVSLRLPRPYWKSDLLVNGTVRQSRKIGDLNFVGLEFDRPLEDPSCSLLMQL